MMIMIHASEFRPPLLNLKHSRTVTRPGQLMGTGKLS